MLTLHACLISWVMSCCSGASLELRRFEVLCNVGELSAGIGKQSIYRRWFRIALDDMEFLAPAIVLDKHPLFYQAIQLGFSGNDIPFAQQ